LKQFTRITNLKLIIMKIKLLSLALLGMIVLFSCKESAETTATEESATPNDTEFDAKVAVVQALFKAHEEEDLVKMDALLSDSLVYSPPRWNDNQWLGKAEFLEGIKATHENAENLKFTPGIVLPDTTAGAYFAGRNHPIQQTEPTGVGIIRAYGSWSSTNAATGDSGSVKWYGLFVVNDDGKITLISGYFDALDSGGQTGEE